MATKLLDCGQIRQTNPTKSIETECNAVPTCQYNANEQECIAKPTQELLVAVCQPCTKKFFPAQAHADRNAGVEEAIDGSAVFDLACTRQGNTYCWAQFNFPITDFVTKSPRDISASLVAELCSKTNFIGRKCFKKMTANAMRIRVNEAIRSFIGFLKVSDEQTVGRCVAEIEGVLQVAHDLDGFFSDMCTTKTGGQYCMGLLATAAAEPTVSRCLDEVLSQGTCTPQCDTALSGSIYPSAVKFLVDYAPMKIKFEKCFAIDRHVYAKGAVHEGKSSFARTYQEKADPKTCCYIGCDTVYDKDPKMMETKILTELQRVWSFTSINDVFTLKDTDTLLFDECHRLFMCADESVGSLFVKGTCLNCRVAYFSTTQFGMKLSGDVGTPPSITNKVVLPWRFTRDEVTSLIPAMILGLSSTVIPDDEAVDVLFSLFCGHRGMTIMTLGYLREAMEQDSQTDLTFKVIHSYLCRMLRCKEGGLQSRAVKINGQDVARFPNGDNYNDNIRTLVQLAIVKGDIEKSVSQKVPQDIQRCVTLGALAPGGLWTHPTDTVKMSDTTEYSIANPFLLRVLNEDTLALRQLRDVPNPILPVDAVLSGLSHMPFHSLFNIGTTTTL